MAGTAVDSGKEVAATAKEEAAERGGGDQAAGRVVVRHRPHRGGSQQAGTSADRIAEALHSLSKELGGMASSSQESGPLTDLAHQASRKGGEIAHWLQDREPADVLEAVRSYARRRPGTFLVLCGLAGDGRRPADPQHRRHPDQPGQQGRHRRLRPLCAGAAS